jgi:hypothetical protein
MTDHNQPISPLRQRMLEDMQLRKLAPKTQSAYIRAVKKLISFLHRSPVRADAEDLRRFQLHLATSGTSPTTINATLTGLRFFFAVTLERAEVMNKTRAVCVERKLPVVLSAEEVARMLEHAPVRSTKPLYRLPMALGFVRARWPRSRSATSTASACSFVSNRARADAIVMPYSRRRYSPCCAPGGAMPTRRARCCPAAGCSRDKTRSIQCQRVSSTGPVTRRPNTRASTSACLCIRFATRLRLTCSSKGSTSASSRCCSDTPSSIPPRCIAKLRPAPFAMFAAHWRTSS